MQKQFKNVAKQVVDTALSTHTGHRIARKVANYVLDQQQSKRIRKSFYWQFAAEDDGRVLRGPYQGMTVVDEFSWGAFEPSYILGCYEQEIQSVLASHDWRRNTSAVDIGCANGYHAVGLARLAPALAVHAFDIDARAGQVTEKMARANGVEDRVSVHGEFAVEQPNETLGDRPFFLVDIEGAETDLVPELLRHYPDADLLIECHDRRSHHIRTPLQRVLQPSHRVLEIHRDGRSPAIHPAIEQLSDNQAWTILSENRSRSDIWLYCLAR